MKKFGSYPLILAGLLHLAPLWQQVSPIVTGGGAPAIAIIRSLMLLAGVFGSVDALSGASISIPAQTFHAKVGVKTNFTVNIVQDYSYPISVISFTAVSPVGVFADGLTFTNTQVSFAPNPVIYFPVIKGTPLTAGTYVVRVTAKEKANASTERTTTGNVTLIIAPGDLPATVSTAPLSQTVTEGGSATFSVVASGSTPINFQWYFNTNTLISNATNASLTLNPVSLSNAGMYSVWVTNKFGGMFSPSARLTVNPKVFVPPFSLGAPVWTNGGMRFSLPGVANAAYTVQFLPALKGATWQLFKTLPTPTTSGPISVDVPTTGAQGWYRVNSTP